MVQAFLFPCIYDLFLGNVWQIQRNNGKGSYRRMSGFGKMKIQNLSIITMIRNTWKGTVEQAKTHKELQCHQKTTLM